MAEGFNLDAVERIFNYAAKKFDHFPSIAQVEEVAEHLGINGSKKSKAQEIRSIQNCKFCNNEGYYIFQTLQGNTCAAGCMRCELGKYLVANKQFGVSHLYWAIEAGYFPGKDYPKELFNDSWRTPGGGMETVGTHILRNELKFAEMQRSE